MFVKMADDLIELVRQHRELYDIYCKDYRDHSIRNAAWEEIAEMLNEPADKCKEDWGKLRNAFSCALKRRRKKKSAQSAATLSPWKYEESMKFLVPHMETRKTKTNIMDPPESHFVTVDDSGGPSYFYGDESSSSCEHIDKKPKLQDLCDLTKSSHDLERQQNDIQDMDETDLFFLSMSNAVKALPKLDQIKIKLDVHTAISRAEIRQLEHRGNT